MKKFMINREVIETHGYQTFEVEAESAAEAHLKFIDGEGEFVSEEVEVTRLGAALQCEIYEA